MVKIAISVIFLLLFVTTIILYITPKLDKCICCKYLQKSKYYNIKFDNGSIIFEPLSIYNKAFVFYPGGLVKPIAYSFSVNFIFWFFK